MTGVRRSNLRDLTIVASWIRSPAECWMWCGAVVTYPIDLAALPDALEYDRSESWTAIANDQVVAFGQLFSKAGGRLHLARLISAPERRGEGYGRAITTHLLDTAIARKPSSISLNVFADNERAVSLYESLGFVPARRPSEERDSPSIYMEYANGDESCGKSREP